MTAKEYLGQVNVLDKRINAKKLQVEATRDAAEKANSVLTGMPNSATTNIRRMDDIIAKLVDLENELAADIENLCLLRLEVTNIIFSLDDSVHATLLSLRYLQNKDWHDIADEMRYSYRHILKLHSHALKKVDTKRHPMPCNAT